MRLVACQNGRGWAGSLVLMAASCLLWAGCGNGVAPGGDGASAPDGAPADGGAGTDRRLPPDDRPTGNDVRLSDRGGFDRAQPSDRAGDGPGPGEDLTVTPDFPPGTMACTRASAGDCPLGTTCDIEGCNADSPGGCLATPDLTRCPEAPDPVCGCDGYTYATDCHRLRAGVGRAHRGECAEAGPCGPTGQSPLCDDTHVCDHRDCSGGGGRCAPLYASCPEGGQPECGCDGETYANACQRLRAGVALDHAGRC